MTFAQPIPTSELRRRGQKVISKLRGEGHDNEAETVAEMVTALKQPRLFTLEQTAELLNLRIGLLKHLHRNGKIEVIDVDGQLAISEKTFAKLREPIAGSLDLPIIPQDELNVVVAEVRAEMRQERP